LGSSSLDELGEFPHSTLEVLRQPLEEGTVTIARAAGTLTFPARLMFLASLNPCPCGYRGVRGSDCRCDDAAIQRYLGKAQRLLQETRDRWPSARPFSSITTTLGVGARS
jgi:magnesium chelatase family protein